MPPSRRMIGLLIYPGCLATDVCGPADLFASVGRVPLTDFDWEPAYDVMLVGADSAPVASFGGFLLTPQCRLDALESLDTLIVPGADQKAQEALLQRPSVAAELCRLAGGARRTASVCTGAFVLAALGLLDGRTATTHWQFCHTLARRYPQVKLQPNALFVRDGNIHTSAGISAGMDLALALIEADLGRRTALELAKLFVLHLKRSGGQSQFSSDLAAQFQVPERLEPLLDWLREHLHEPLSVSRMAEQANMSVRSLTRICRAELEMSPRRLLELLRTDRARRLIEQSDQPLKRIARHAGFPSEQRLRMAFLRRLGITPSEHAARTRLGTAKSCQ